LRAKEIPSTRKNERARNANLEDKAGKFSGLRPKVESLETKSQKKNWKLFFLVCHLAAYLEKYQQEKSPALPSSASLGDQAGK